MSPTGRRKSCKLPLATVLHHTDRVVVEWALARQQVSKRKRSVQFIHMASSLHIPAAQVQSRSLRVDGLCFARDDTIAVRAEPVDK